MDFMLTKEDCESREDLFDPKLMKYNSDFMLENWSPNSLDLMDSIFDTDILNFDEIDNLSKQNIIEPETYSTINQINTSFENVLSSCVAESPISSNSSDSGLSSDNLETDISPEYEPFSPAVSSPGPSISERGEKNSPSRNNESISSPYLEHLFTTATPANFEEEKHDNDIKQIQIISQQKQPQQQQQQQQQQQIQLQQQQQKQKQPTKVVVRKIPQIINLPTKRSLAQSFGNNAVKEKEIKIVKISPQPFNVSNNKKMTTIQVKNPNTGTKIQSKSGTIVINNKANVSEVKKFIPIQTTTNPRSILLPVTVQDMKGIKAYKVFNVSTLKNYSNNNAKKIPTAAAVPVVKPVQENPDIIKIKPKIKEEMYSEYISDVDSLILEDIKQEDTTDGFIEECDDNDDESDNSVITVANTMTNTSDSSYPKLILSAEEKRLLAKEGITLPSHYPLTKYEERELKRIRRKIRNKISAQDSRKRKKEYVDGLEERVKQCTEENQTLLKKIKLLQTQNQNLMSQMKKLQALLSKGTNKTAHPTTCLLVILLSLALVATPNLKFGQNLKESELNEFAQDVAAAAADDVLQNRRSLLFDAKDHYNNDIFDEDLNVNDFIAANEIAINNGAGNNGLNDFVMNLNNCKMNNDSNNETVCKKLKNLIDFDVDDTNWYQQNKETQKIQQQQQEKLQKTVYDLAAETYQKNRSQQTSGFNIKQNGYDNDNIFDKNIIEMMSKRSNPGLYEINIEKFGGSMDVAATAAASAATATGTNIKISE